MGSSYAVTKAGSTSSKLASEASFRPRRDSSSSSDENIKAREGSSCVLYFVGMGLLAPPVPLRGTLTFWVGLPIFPNALPMEEITDSSVNVSCEKIDASSSTSILIVSVRVRLIIKHYFNETKKPE